MHLSYTIPGKNKAKILLELCGSSANTRIAVTEYLTKWTAMKLIAGYSQLLQAPLS